MQDIAAENNLSETAFFHAQGDAFELRWFTPTTEVDLCGHATLATAFVLFNELGHKGDVIRFQALKHSLVLGATRDGDKVAMDFPAWPSEPGPVPAALADGLGWIPTEVRKTRDYL